jgi:hypothetical protein
MRKLQMGKVYGRLTPHFLISIKGATSQYAICKCTCGEWCLIRAPNVGRHARSCGCLKTEKTTAKNTKHGLYYTKAYRAAHAAMQRCYNPSQDNYENYGGRGIGVKFSSRSDMAEYIAELPGYGQPGLSLDRVDNDGHYEPGNLRWATRGEQVRNRRKNRLKFMGSK